MRRRLGEDRALFPTSLFDPCLDEESSRRRGFMRVAVLGSGSGGNSLVVESPGGRLLVDAGFSCREIERRLARVGVEPGGMAGLVLTHEHGDHIRGADRFFRRHRVPLFATAGTVAAGSLGAAATEATSPVCSGVPFAVGSFQVEPFSLPHDGREPVGLVVEDEAGWRVGIVADLGARTRLAWGRLQDLDILILETNHDLEMLREGPYPWSLKQRVAGRHGHLSNRDASEGIPELVSDRLGWVALYHLSRTNNLAALAGASVGEALERAGSRARVVVTAQDEPSEWMEVGS